MKSDGVRLSRLQSDAIERNELADWELHSRRTVGWCAQVDLWRLIAIHVTGVADPDGQIETAVARRDDLEVGIVERGVAQPMAERKQRLDALPIEPTIADVHAFAEGGLVGHAST